MADCSYSRCIQQRRNIKRELQRWTKNMVHIVGLERIAEELMGRRQWKLYQESMSRSYLQPLNNNVKTRASEDYHQKDHHQETQQNAFTKSAEKTTEDLNHHQQGSIREDAKDDETSRDEQERITRQEEAEDRLRDWSPQSKCYFCVDGKLDSENTTHGVLSPRNSDSDSSDNSHSDSEAPPTLTPSAGAAGLFNNHHANSMTTIESVTSMAALAAVAALSGNSPGNPAVPHLPFYGPAGLLQPNWYLANVARNFQQADRVAADVEKTTTATGEQPLDLSSKGGGNISFNQIESKMAPSIRLPTLDTKHIFNSDFRAKPRMSAVAGRRTYTEDELQAALRDIQSGKLGTRRAAVIYGIPRSTLRNKVYKLALEKERETHLNSSTPLKIDEEEAMDDDKELSGAEEEKEVEKALQAPLLSMADILRFSNLENNPEALKTILQKTKEGQDIWAGLEHSSVGPYIQNFLMASAPKMPDGDMNAMLPEVVRRMIVEDQLFKEQLKTQINNGDSEKLTRPSPSNSVIIKTERVKSESSDMETDESPSNVILKIPSFKPTTSKNGCDLFRGTLESGSLVSPPVTSESGSPPILPGKGMSIKDVKDAIAQSISQKFQQNMEPARRPLIDMDFKRGGFTPPLGGISVIKNQQEMNRAYQQPPKMQQNTNNAPTQGGKGTRPKRGKYRNYDRDSLVEAVRAVQRGEMSVHRAGSYYGVPHSTLEYKVKERHLMRPRKRDPKPNPVDEKLASIKQNELRNTPDKLKPALKPPQKFPPTSPNGMKIPMFDPSIPPLPGYNPPPFPFWPHPGFHHIPLDYGRNPSTSFTPNPQEFFASQMMQKLQEESSRAVPNAVPNTPALAKSARQMAESLLDGTGSNGSFLDGIIRSSLESGVPSNDDKLKEDKNVAPENMSNKALLDQLCRNSRLTPLPKPNVTTDPSSSGDESYRKGMSPLNFVTKEDASSPKSYENSDVHTIELSNDSNESSRLRDRDRDRDQDQERKSTPPARIYLKQDLVKPENLKPEMLMRFHPDMERNGVGESATGSASESDAAQD